MKTQLYLNINRIMSGWADGSELVRGSPTIEYGLRLIEVAFEKDRLNEAVNILLKYDDIPLSKPNREGHFDNFETFTFKIAKKYIARGNQESAINLYKNLVAQRWATAPEPKYRKDVSGMQSYAKTEIWTKQGISLFRKFLDEFPDWYASQWLDSFEKRVQKGECTISSLSKKKGIKIIEEIFWQLIKEAAETSVAEGRSSAFSDALVNLLLPLGKRQVLQFQNILRQKLMDLHRNEFYTVSWFVTGSFAFDNFDFFKAWIIVQGPDFFAQFISDPVTSVAKLVEANTQCQHEGLIQTSLLAFSEAGGRDMPDSAYYCPPEISGAVEKECLQRTYPELWSKKTGAK